MEYEFHVFSDHKALENIEKVEDHNARVQRWLEYLTAFDYPLDYRTGSAKEISDFLLRLSQPATKDDRSGSSRFIPVDDDAIYLVRACGLRTSSTSNPAIGLIGQGPQPDSAVLSGLPLTSTDFRDFRAHRPRKRIDDLSAPTGTFVARLSALVGTGDDGLGRAPFCPAADANLSPVFAVPSGAYSTRPTPAVAYAPIGDFSGTAAYRTHLYSDAPQNSRCGRRGASCR